MKILRRSLQILSIVAVLLVGAAVGGPGLAKRAAPAKTPPTQQVKFERTGGGSITYVVADSAAFFQVEISQFHFHDTSLQVRLDKSKLTAGQNSTLAKLFKGAIKIDGKPKVQHGMTGTWAHAYVRRDTSWVPVTTPAVLDTLATLQGLVEGALAK